MGTMPVVIVQPEFKLGLAFGGVQIQASIGPFAQSGLDEALGLAVGAGSVGSGAQMANAELVAGSGKPVRVEAGSVVGEPRRMRMPRRA
jgi:hypothetical protein